MEENHLPPGFRFHPSDEELITFYLSKKVSDFGFTSKAIVDVDLNKSEPWDLPAKASMGEKEWYFFSLKDRKYPTGLRTNRATEAGYWKTTGKDREIFQGEMLIGMKKTLVFYKGRAPKGEKTNWVMHEYRLHSNLSFKPTKEEWVVCRVFQKSAIMRMPHPNSPLQPSQDSLDDINTNANEFGDIDQLPNMSSLSNSSSGFNYPSLGLGSYSSNNHLNTNLNLNWVRDISSLPSSSWPSSLLTPNLNSTVNSLLLKALQLRSAYQPSEATTLDYSLLGQGLPLGTDLNSSFPSSSTNEVLESTSQQQYQQQQQQQQEQQLLQEQSFNMDSMW